MLLETILSQNLKNIQLEFYKKVILFQLTLKKVYDFPAFPAHFLKKAYFPAFPAFPAPVATLQKMCYT